MRNIFDNNLLANYSTTGDETLANWGLEVSVTANTNTLITLPYTTSTTPVGEYESQTEGRVLIRKKDNSANTVTIEPFAGCTFNGILGNIVLKSQNDYVTFSNNNGNVINIHDTNLPNLIKIDGVDLKAYIDTSVAGLLDYRGVYDASSNQYPSTGGSGTAGAVLKSDTWIVSVAGTLNSQPVKVGDMIIAKVNNPAQTPANWNVLAVSVYNNSISNALLALMDAFTVKMNNTNAPANPQDIPINTAFNQSFETNTANIKMNGTVSVGASNNIARADHVHASDTTKQNLISGATADDIVSTNSSGQVLDSGKAFSTDTSLSSNSNNKIPTEQVVKYNVDYLNNRINNLPVGAGEGNLYFLTNDINGSYLTLSTTPKNGTQATLTATANNNSVLLGSFATASALNRTTIDAGAWEFNLWCFAESIQATTNIYAEIYKLSSTNVETLLFTLNNSNNIGSTSVIYYSISGTQPSYTILATDKLLVKFYAKTTRTQDTIVTMYYNSQQYYSHMHTPLVITHNQLAGLNGGDGANQYYHLTQTQYNNVINQASTSQTGYLSSTDFTTFNNKQNALTNPVTSSSATPTANQLPVFNASGTQVTPTTTLPTSAVPAFTGDVTSAGGSLALTIANGAVTNSKLANSSITIAGNSTALGGSVTQDQITGLSATGLVKRTLANTLGIATINDLPFTFNNTYYVSPNGNNSNDGKTLATPVLTLAQALTLAGNSGVQIVVLPGIYAENTTITAQNVTITAPNREQSGIVSFSGTITVSNTASSIRLSGLSIANLTHAGAGSLYLERTTVNIALSKTGGGYLEVTSSDSQGSSFAGIVSITGSGSVLFINRCTTGTMTINNASAVVTISNNINASPITLTAGTLGINDTPVYASSGTTSAVTVASGGICYITNSTMLTPTNTNARITMSSGSFYSLNNAIYDKTNSTLSGTILTRTGYSDSIELTTALPITSGGTGSGVRQTAINNLAGAVTNAQFLRGNGTNVIMSAIQATDVPLLNQNTTGTSTSVTGTNVVTNTNLAQMPSNTIKGNNTGATANASDLTATQVTAILDNFVGDSGSGGIKGLVPAPAAGDGAANKYLNALGGWTDPAGGSGGTISQYFHAKPAIGVNTWDANRRMQFSQVLNSLGNNITLASTGIVRLNSAGTYKLTAVWQGTQSAGGVTIQWYNETFGGFVGQNTVISPSDSTNTTSTNSVLIYTATVTSATNFSIRGGTGDNLQPNAASSYIIVEQINNVTSDGTVLSPIYMSTRDASSNNGTALQTITNSVGSTAWTTAASNVNRININGNLITSNANAFTVGTNSITVLQAGAYLVQFSVDGANSTNLGSNVQIYTQLVQNGNVIAVNQDQPANANNYTNNVINVIINCLANDVLDFRINAGSGTPNIAINSYNLNIIKQGNISQPANNVTSAFVANNGTLTVDNLIITATGDNGRGFLIATTSGTVSASINAYAVSGTNYLFGTFHTESYNITTTPTNPWGWTAMNQNNNEAVIRLRNNTNNKYYEIKVQLSPTTHIIAVQTLI